MGQGAGRLAVESGGLIVIKCVVPVSGGKDSQSCLKLACESFPKDQIQALFCDTQFEHPVTYQHIETIERLYGVPVTRISDGDVITRCLRYGRFPGGGARFCTDDLKIKPTKRFIENLAARQGDGFEVWYGMRQDESLERRERYKDLVSYELHLLHEVLPSKYPAHLADMGVTCRLPILDWTTGDVMDYLNGEHNPLYDEGFDRVGCFPCLASGDVCKERAFQFDQTGKDHYALVRIVEERTGKSVWTSKGGSQRNNENQGCLFCAY